MPVKLHWKYLEKRHGFTSYWNACLYSPNCNWLKVLLFSKSCVCYLATPRTMQCYSAVSLCTLVRKPGCCLVWGYHKGRLHMYLQERKSNTSSVTGYGILPLARSIAFRIASVLYRKCSVSLMMKMWVSTSLIPIWASVLNKQSWATDKGWSWA